MQKKKVLCYWKKRRKELFLKTDIFFFYNRHTGLIVLIKKSVYLSEVDMKKKRGFNVSFFIIFLKDNNTEVRTCFWPTHDW